MKPEPRYIGQINPGNTRSLWRLGGTSGIRVPTYAWAADGTIGWGSAHDPTMADRELDCALAILTDHHGDAQIAFDQAAQLANDVLAYQRPTGELLLHETVLHAYTPTHAVDFHADATPVRDLIVATIADTGDPLEVAASGLGLDPGWTRDVATGQVDYLDLDQVRQVCQRLYVTPHDLWPLNEAAVIEGLWPASQWPCAQPVDLTAPISTAPDGFTPAPGTEPAATLDLEAVR